MEKKLYFCNDKIFSQWNYLFYILIGGRGIGKTYSTMNYCLKRFFEKGEPFLWMRLNEGATKKLLQCDGKDFLDPLLLTKYKITGVKVKGNTVFITQSDDPDDEDSYIEMCRILALSTFYSTKGTALHGGEASIVNKRRTTGASKAMVTKTVKDYKTIVLDEMSKEKCEANRLDITYALVNQLETICRLSLDKRIIFTSNTLEEASDIMVNAFNFIPEKFGVYKLKNKRAIIAYIDDGELYKEARKQSIAGILDNGKYSTFSNVVKSDADLITPSYDNYQSMVIRFSDTLYFTVCGMTITMMKQPPASKLPVVTMRPYLIGYPYYKEQSDMVIKNAQARYYRFDKLITLKKFYHEIKLLKGDK